MCASSGASLVAQMVMNLSAMQGTQVRSLGQEEPWRKEYNPLQCSCLENSMNRGAWWATVYVVVKSRTQLSEGNDIHRSQNYRKYLIHSIDITKSKLL